MDDISSEALLFQTGYLTVHQVEQPIVGYWLYTLDYPNQEVETSLNESLLPALGLEPGRAATGGQGAGAAQRKRLCR